MTLKGDRADLLWGDEMKRPTLREQAALRYEEEQNRTFSPLLADLTVAPAIIGLSSGFLYVASTLVPIIMVGLAGVLSVVALIYLAAPKARTSRVVFPLWVGLAAIIYIAMSTLDMVFLNGSFLPMFIRRLEFFVFLLLLLFVSSKARWSVVSGSFRIGIAVAILIVGADYFIPQVSKFANVLLYAERREYLSTHRAFGLFNNPNSAGAFMAFGAVIIAARAPLILRLVAYAATFLAILATASRGSIVIWAVGLLLVETLNVTPTGPQRVRFLPLLAVSGGLIIVGLAVLQNAVAPTSMKLVGVGAEAVGRLSTLGDSSTRERGDLIQFAWSQFLLKPIFGHGVGYDYNWALPRPVHNIYLLMLVEHGVVGLLWFALFLASLIGAPRPFGIIGPILIAVKGLFNHSVFNEVADALLISMFFVKPGLESARNGAPIGGPLDWRRRTYARPRGRRDIAVQSAQTIEDA